MVTFFSSLLLFSAGLAILLFSGSLLTRASLRFAELLSINPLIAGLTITAFATSAPEAAISVHAALQDTHEIAIGNVIGSNITNILLVLGLPAIFATLSTQIRQLRRHLLFMLVASFAFFFAALTGSIDRWVGLVFLLFVIAWVVYSFKSGAPMVAEEVEEAKEEGYLAAHPFAFMFLYLGLSIFGLWAGATLTLTGAQSIAEQFQISHAVIALTLVAFGTSLPELATSIAALWQKHADIAIGNIVGSNLLNILFVLGLSATLVPLSVEEAFIKLDLLVMLAAALLLAPLIWTRRPLKSFVGILFVSLYALYITSLALLRPTLLG